MNLKLYLHFVFCALLTVSTSKLSYAQNKDFQLAENLYYQGFYDSAIVILEKVKEQSLHDTLTLVKIHFALGENYANTARCKSAVENIETGIKLNKLFTDDQQLYCEGLYYLGRAKSGCFDNQKEAMGIFHKSLKLKRKIYGVNHPQLAFEYTRLGYCFNNQSKVDSAFFYLNRALNIRRNNTDIDSIDLSHTLLILAHAKKINGDLKSAKRFALEALEIQEKFLRATHPTVSNTLSELGSITSKFGDFESALNWYQRALTIRKKTLGEEHTNVGASYYSIGNLCGNMFNYHRAIEYIHEGNKIFSKIQGENSGTVLVYSAYLGKMYYKSGNLEKAFSILSDSKQKAEQHLPQNHAYLGIIYNILSEYHFDQLNHEEGKYYANKAIHIYRKNLGINSTREADILVKLADDNALQKNLEISENQYLQSLAIYRKKIGLKNPKVGHIYMGLGNLKILRDQGSEAMGLYLKALSSVSVDTSSIMDGSYPKVQSITHPQLALQIVSRISKKYQTDYENTNDITYLTSALEASEYSISIINTIRSQYQLEASKNKLQEDNRGIFENALDIIFTLYILTNDIVYKNKMLSIMEYSKVSILRSKLNDVKALKASHIPDSLLETENNILTELSYNKNELRKAIAKKNDSLTQRLYKRVFDTQRSLESFKESLSIDYPKYYQYRYSLEASSLTDSQLQLASGEAVINYFEGFNHIYIITFNKNQSFINRVTVNKEFNELLKNYNASLTDIDLIFEDQYKADHLFSSSAFGLSKLLVTDVLKHYTDFPNKLLIIPDNRLSQMNFSTFLVDSVNSFPIEYDQLSYLITKSSINYAYSLQTQSEPLSLKPRADFIGFAPSYKPDLYASLDSTNHPATYALVRDGSLPLPGAISEVKEISKLMNGSAWLNEDASESNFKKYSGDYRIIHLAMHSLLNNKEPQYSELLFNHAEDSLNDGFLTVDEIYNLKLQAELVVLSACSSGSGKIQLGEGPISFSRGFTYAGCPSVVMSMWKIPDESTKEIMLEFYINLLDGQSKDVALANAQLNYLKKADDPLKKHPLFWGGFVTLGDPKPLSQNDNVNVTLILISTIISFLLILFLPTIIRKNLMVK